MMPIMSARRWAWLVAGLLCAALTPAALRPAGMPAAGSVAADVRSLQPSLAFGILPRGNTPKLRRVPASKAGPPPGVGLRGFDEPRSGPVVHRVAMRSVSRSVTRLRHVISGRAPPAPRPI